MEAARYAAGEPRRVAVPLLDLTAVAEAGAELATQLVLGEAFTVYETRPDGLAWGQAALDGYVGYVRADGLGPAQGPRLRVTAPWSQVYERPLVRARTGLELPCLAEVAVGGTTGGFARLRGGGFVPRAHLAPVGDWVALAERFQSARPISGAGAACAASTARGWCRWRCWRRAARRRATPTCRRRCSARRCRPKARLRRGDLVFWKGHVGIMRDGATLLHANAHHMAVVSEPLAAAVARIAEPPAAGRCCCGAGCDGSVGDRRGAAAHQPEADLLGAPRPGRARRRRAR